jgi:hypothetical protein
MFLKREENLTSIELAKFLYLEDFIRYLLKGNLGFE